MLNCAGGSAWDQRGPWCSCAQGRSGSREAPERIAPVTSRGGHRPALPGRQRVPRRQPPALFQCTRAWEALKGDCSPSHEAARRTNSRASLRHRDLLAEAGEKPMNAFAW